MSSERRQQRELIAGPAEREQELLVGRSPAFARALEDLALAAPHDVTVLIEGETGTGKELFARMLHGRSPRRHQAFVTVNCAALPAELVESEFFGHKRGAFTHAHQDRVGLIAEADQGTLFLDEVSAMEMRLQGKLLRFLQEREYRQVGGDRTLSADVRVIAASNEVLEHAARAGKFRWDLFYRLQVFPLRVPPLRDRREDVPLLVRHFLDKHSRRFALGAPTLSPDAMEVLMGHDWPGNVRELESMVQALVIRHAGRVVRAADLPLAMRGTASREREEGPRSFGEQKATILRDFERAYLRELMLHHRGNVSRAARAAGKNRRALTELLKKNGIDPRLFRRAQ